jgi:transcriptional regulator with XRE-family HTH domain
MSQTHQLVDALKRCLKARGLTYKDLADRMSLSEASVKRVFAERTFTLARLEQVCGAVGVDFLELARLASARGDEEMGVFTLAQEKALAADAKLFACFYSLVSGQSGPRLITRSPLGGPAVTRLLVRLDALGLIRLSARNEARLLVSENVKWLVDGPLVELYGDRLKNEFVDSRFRGTLERFRLLNGRLSEASIRQLSRKLDKLIGEFYELSEVDELAPAGSSGGGDKGHKRIWFMLAYRPFSFSVVRDPKPVYTPKS